MTITTPLFILKSWRFKNGPGMAAAVAQLNDTTIALVSLSSRWNQPIKETQTPIPTITHHLRQGFPF
jgi:hypothetical protein